MLELRLAISYLNYHFIDNIYLKLSLAKLSHSLFYSLEKNISLKHLILHKKHFDIIFFLKFLVGGPSSDRIVVS